MEEEMLEKDLSDLEIPLKFCSIILNEAIDEIKISQLIKSKGKQEDSMKKQKSKTLENFEKLQKDTKFAEDILKDLVQEINEKQSCETLRKKIEEFEETKKINDTVIANFKESILQLAKIERQLEEGEVKWYKDMKEKDEFIGKLKDEYENLVTECRIKQNYIAKWQNSKVEQTLTRIQIEEEKQANIINALKLKRKTETRVNLEINKYFDYKIQELEQTTENWKEKYETDLNNLEKNLEDLHNEKTNVQEKIKYLKELYKERNEEMEAYAELKEKRRLEEEEIARLNAEATKIQAWWRGVMVRRKLGPYKPKKSRKGKKKK